MREGRPDGGHQLGRLGVRINLVSRAQDASTKIAAEFRSQWRIIEDVGREGPQLRFMVLGHVEAKFAQIGSIAMGVDAHNVRFGQSESHALAANCVGRSACVRQSFRLVDNEQRAAVNADIASIVERPGEPSCVLAVFVLGIALLDQELAIVIVTQP